MKMTPEFLEWFATNYPCTAKAVGHGDLDARGNQNIAWSGWQASREALVIELPQEEPGYMYYAPDMVKAIEAAGVKCEVKS